MISSFIIEENNEIAKERKKTGFKVEHIHNHLAGNQMKHDLKVVNTIPDRVFFSMPLLVVSSALCSGRVWQ